MKGKYIRDLQSEGEASFEYTQNKILSHYHEEDDSGKTCIVTLEIQK